MGTNLEKVGGWPHGGHGPVIGPVVAHVPCELDQQRRLRQALADGAARRAGPSRMGSVVGTLLRRAPRSSSRGYAELDLTPRGEDVWKALRF
jgi:hypothetical protein